MLGVCERILESIGDKNAMVLPLPPVDVIMRQRIGMDVMKNIERWHGSWVRVILTKTHNM